MKMLRRFGKKWFYNRGLIFDSQTFFETPHLFANLIFFSNKPEDSQAPSVSQDSQFF